MTKVYNPQWNADGDGWICECELTLSQALARGETLPQPKIGEEQVL